MPKPGEPAPDAIEYMTPAENPVGRDNETTGLNLEKQREMAENIAKIEQNQRNEQQRMQRLMEIQERGVQLQEKANERILELQKVIENNGGTQPNHKPEAPKSEESPLDLAA